MAKKKTTPSRVQQFKARQRSSWFRYIGKLILFFVPIVIATIWLVLMILGRGTELPILVLDFRPDATPQSLSSIWRSDYYGPSNKSGIIQLPSEGVRFGGPQKDVLVVFNDLLGSARRSENNEGPTAQIFRARNLQEHQSHAFYGLLADETVDHKNQWVGFGDYVHSLIQQINQSTRAENFRSLHHVLLVLDIDHPDLPARTPPQADAFIKLCVEDWELSVRQRLKEAFPNLEVFVWLSHSPAQKSYCDSDPAEVESFFKHRFERAISGNAMEIFPEGAPSKNITYENLKNYIKTWVESDSNVHYLAQSPVSLEPEGWNEQRDFPMLKCVPESTAKTGGKLFAYERRSPNSEIDLLWKRFEDVKRQDRWTLENPLLLQRATMMLVQLEQLWYQGKDSTDLFAEIKRKLNSTLSTHLTIRPVLHTLHDAWQLEREKTASPISLPSFDLTWLRAPKESADGSVVLEEEEANAAAAIAKQTKKWHENFPDWPAALSVWSALREAAQLQRSDIVAALKFLKPRQMTVDQSAGAESAGVQSIAWNEVAYMQRLADELIWPNVASQAEQHKKFEELVRLSMRVRDQSNRCDAELSAVFVDQYSQKFEELEHRRRMFEDRLFANSHVSLRNEFLQLESEFQTLSRKHRLSSQKLQQILSQLVASPHQFRYCLESLSVEAYHNTLSDDQSPIIEDFMARVNGDDGFLAERQRMANLEFATFENGLQDGSSETLTLDIPTSIVGVATSPAADLVRLRDTDLNMGVADGNLLGRRLLLWPDLDLAIRQQIREALSKEGVRLSRDAENEALDKPDVPVREFSEASVATELEKAFSAKSLDLLTLFDRTEIALSSEEERYFQLVASDIHRLTIRDFDTTTDNIGVVINRLRSKKSDLDFQRIAADLWATPVTSSGTPFTIGAMSNHDRLTNDRIRSLENVQTDFADIWRAGPLRNWQPRTEALTAFCNRFNQWRWDAKRQIAANPELPIEATDEYQRRSDLVFSLSPQPVVFDKVHAVVLDPARKTLKPDSVTRQLQIYFRGHQDEITSGGPDPLRLDKFEVKLQNAAPGGASLQVKRSNRPTSGHVTIVIDCSRSMKKNNRMNTAKNAVKKFLRAAEARADIEISLVAIGATDLWVAEDKPWEDRPDTKISQWEESDQSDTWFFRQNNQVVNSESIGGMINAIDQLEAFGATPILTGLDKTLNSIGEQTELPELVILLTDGFEFTNLPNGDMAAFDNTLYQKLREQLTGPSVELVVFNMMRGDVAEAFLKTIKQGVPADEIQRRISKINNLATIRMSEDNADNASVSSFLTGLLPHPMIIVAGTDPTLKKEVQVTDAGIDLDRDEVVSKDERSIMANLELAANDRPKDWSVSVEFPKTAHGRVAESFIHGRATWNSDAAIAGNERLQFEYDAIGPRFQLLSGSRGDENASPIEFNGQTLLAWGTHTRQRKPEFELASKDANKLTPAPALAFVTLTESTAADVEETSPNTALLQDFNLNRQSRSNVHPIEFPEFPDELRNRIFGNAAVDIKLHLMPEFSSRLWTKISLTGDAANSIENDKGKSLQLIQGSFVSIEELLPKGKPFSHFVVEMSRDADTNRDFVNLSLRVRYRESALQNGEAKSLDRWLVQLLGPDGSELNRTCRHSTARSYSFPKRLSQNRQLLGVEHKFTLKKDQLQISRAFFGIAHIDDLGDAKILHVNYPKYFKQK